MLDCGGEVDPQPSGGTAAGGQVARFSPCVDDVGLDAEAAGDVGDAQLVLPAGRRVGVGMLVGRSRRRAPGRRLLRRAGRGWPSVRRARGGRRGSGVDPVVDGAGGHAGPLGDLAGRELAVFEEAGIGDVVVVPQGRRWRRRRRAGRCRCGAGVVERGRPGRCCPGRGRCGRRARSRRDRWRAAGWRFLRRVTWTCWLAPDFQRSPDAQARGVAGGGGEGDVAEQGAQQPLAVLVAGGRGPPQGGQIGDGGG